MLILGVFLNHLSILLVFKQRFSLNLELAALARLVTSKFSRCSWYPPCLSQAMVTAVCGHVWLLQGVGDPNSGHQACTNSWLMGGISLAPCFYFLRQVLRWP